VLPSREKKQTKHQDQYLYEQQINQESRIYQNVRISLRANKG
jgi:hypothetical protein